MSGFTGTWPLIRLAVRRDRVNLPAWIVSMTLFLAATTAIIADNYAEHPQLLAPDTRIVVENPGMRVLGLATGTSVGSYALHRDALTLAVLAAVMSTLAVVRHTRQAEELGREEMLRAGVVGRSASLVAAVLVTLGANVVLALMLGLGMVVAGQPVAGSFIGGASIAAVGVVFTGVAAVASQVSSTARGSIGLTSAALGSAFILAAFGNMTGSVNSASLRVVSAWPAWLSPIGWSQQMRPFADNLLWPMALAVLAAALFVAAALALVAARDVGRGLLPDHAGPEHGSVAMLSPEGLVWRLQRGALLGWSAGLLGFGLVFGSLSEQVDDLKGEATQWYEAFGGDVDLLGAYWASMLQIAGAAVIIYTVSLLLHLQRDEAQGTLEPVLATAISRGRWLGAYALNAAIGATVLMLVFAAGMGITGAHVAGSAAVLMRELTGAALLQLPAIGVVAAAVLALITSLPRWAIGSSWALVVAAIVVGPMFGPSLGLPSWLLDLSPFTHVPNAPAESPAAGPVVGLCLAAIILSVLSHAVQRRRDLVLPA